MSSTLISLDESYEMGFCEASVLFTVAERAYHRTLAIECEDREAYCRCDALIAITFSVMAVEAYLKDLTASAKVNDSFRHDEKVKAFAASLEEIDRQKGSTSLALEVASIICSGKSLPRGRRPFQDFFDLVTIRNAIVHLRPLDKVEAYEGGMIDYESADVLKHLVSKNILAEDLDGVYPSWTQRLGTRAVARWSCQVAADCVQAIVEMLPNGEFKLFALKIGFKLHEALSS